MNKNLKIVKGKRVTKANDLIEASYQLAVADMRVVLYCLAQTKLEREEEEITDDKTYTITASTYAKISGVNINTAYRELKEALNNLYESEIIFKGKSVSRVRWIQSLRNQDFGEGQISFRFSKDILPYINRLSKNFTIIRLDDIFQLSSFMQ